jgi:hypothetical protein
LTRLESLFCLAGVSPIKPLKIPLLLLLLAHAAVRASPVESVEEVYRYGMQLLEEEEYDGALFELNKAMGMLKHKYSNPLRAEVEKQIRITQGKIVVSRYARKDKAEKKEEGSGLLPLNKEAEDFRVQQVFGKVLARNLWENRDSLSINMPLGKGRTVTVMPRAGIEIEESRSRAFSLRCVQAASFTLVGPSQLQLHSGSYAISSQTAVTSLRVSSTLTDLTLSSDHPYALMAGVTTNGGMKVICLLGKIALSVDGKSENLMPGELVFALPDGFSRKMNVELSTLIVTSNLLTDFPAPPVYHAKLRQQAMLQAMRTKKKFRTVVGDVKGRENFELKILEEGNL